MRVRQELLAADDASIEDAVRYADPMVLRGLVFQLTGDESVAETRVGTVDVRFLKVSVVTDPSDVEKIQTKAADFLKSCRDAGGGEVGIGPTARLSRSLALTAGEDVADCDLEMWLEQLALDPWARSLVWSTPPHPEHLREFSVLVVGAGMGGLNAAVQLKHAGIPFTLLEKNAGVGGTWYENRYPGARVDTPSRAYTHIYGVDFPYSSPYCLQAENEKYFNWMADNFDVRGSIEFNTEVTSIVWDDDIKRWEVTANSPEGPRTWKPNAVITAVGFLARPNVPAFAGLDVFEGTIFHTARWPADLDLAGKRVAVVGTGCTGYQLIPELVRDNASTYVFQRTPSWVFDVPGYLTPFPPQVSWLDRNLPLHTNFARFRISWGNHPERVLTAFSVDPNFHDAHAVSAHNKNVRDQRLEFLRSKLGDRPEIMEKMIPVTPPMSSRPVVVDRDYNIYDVLRRDDVTLVSAGIRRIVRQGIELEDDSVVEVDVIVLATGFRASDYLWPMEVRGRGGLHVEELWAKDGARAYLGTMLPEFPNFFMIYGPNTNTVGGLGIVDMEEMVTRFALECIGGLITLGKTSVEPTSDAYWRYNAEVDRAEALRTCVDPRANNYYQNKFGRSATQGPLDTRLLWRWLRSPASEPNPDALPAVDERLVETSGALSPYFGRDLIID